MTWRQHEKVERDIKDLDLHIEMVEIQNEWKRRIYVDILVQI